ncbi:MAG TPA: FAD-dependent oxidoreductase [Microlunatus sp.]
MTVSHPTAAELAVADLDVLVVGGGIVGAGAALDAVTRGLRVGLIEGGDWGGGRSGRTSTLVHGGLVDLRRIGVTAVAGLRRERDLLLDRTAPHLVRRVPLLVPLTGGPAERLAVGAGLSLYDAAAFSIRQPGVLPGHRQLPRRAVPRLAPSVAMDGVTGAVQLYEGQVDDARLTITVVRTAMAYGTLAMPRTPVRRLVTDAGPARGTGPEAVGRVIGAEIDDLALGPVTVRARVVVLAAGTELSHLLPGAIGSAAQDLAQPPVAVHLVLPRSRLRASTGLVLREDDRAVYVVPWGRHWIVGTTAAWSEPDRLLAALNRRLARPIQADAVESTFAGPAPLGPDGGRTPTVQVPVPGLVLVRGSGLAGYRSDAERAVDSAVGQIGGLHPGSTTTRVPLLGADGFTARWNQRHLLARRAGVHVVVLEHLLRRYGSGVDALIEEIRRTPALGRSLPGAEDYLAVEVWFAVVHEGATQLRDMLARRTRIAMETWDGGAEAAAGVAELMAAELGWDDAERSRQISHYLRRAAADR